MQILQDRILIRLGAEDIANDSNKFEAMKLWLYKNSEDFLVGSIHDCQEIRFIIDQKSYREFLKAFNIESKNSFELIESSGGF